MKFSERYKKTIEKATPDNECVNRVMQEITDNKAPRKHHAKGLIGIAAAALCVIVLCSVGIPALNKLINKPQDFNTGDIALSYTPNSYDEVYKLIKEYNKKYKAETNGAPGALKGEAVDGVAPETDTAPNDDFSDTNTQVEGVDEADVVKTDGKYIYTLSIINQKAGFESIPVLTLTIYKADGANTKVVSKTTDIQNVSTNRFGAYFSPEYDMYLSGGKLFIIAENDGKTNMYTYDVSSPENPQRLSSIAQDGNYVTSRLTDGVLYIVTREYKGYDIKKNDISTYIPSVNDRDGESVIPCNEIMITSNATDCYTLITSTKIEDSAKIHSRLAILGAVDNMYASKDSIVLSCYDMELRELEGQLTGGGIMKLSNGTEVNYTAPGDLAQSGSYEKVKVQYRANLSRIYRISITDGEVKLNAERYIDGQLLNQFSIDEHNGYIRLVTTSRENYWIDEVGDRVSSNIILDNKLTNNVIVLDEKLNTVGEVTDIAPDETVYSVRFMGDVAYFVTFRTTDPLFSVDLSNPKSPKLIGELKIPGFSNYLHPYSDNLLFGFGQSADENTGSTECLKLSMFDITDPTDVSEVTSYKIENGFYSEAVHNHKAILVAPNKNIIGFPMQGEYGMTYELYSYVNGKFVHKASIQLDQTNFFYDGTGRGLYIGDYIYVVGESVVAVLDMLSYSMVCEVG